jgi:hypothetical protein
VIEGTGQDTLITIQKEKNAALQQAFKGKMANIVIQFVKESDDKITPRIFVDDGTGKFKAVYDKSVYGIGIVGTGQSTKIFVKKDENAEKELKYDGKMFRALVILEQPLTILWTSDSWSRNERTIGPDFDKDEKFKTDPDEIKVRLLKVGKPLPKAVINGNGVCNLVGGSPRFYINGKYQNVEFSAEIFVVENTSQVYLSARSNHEQRKPPGFGGYPLFLDVTPNKQKMFFKKEISHKEGYSERLAEVKIPDFVAGKWFKARARITNIKGGKVKLEGWFNEKEYTSLIDEGQITCRNDETGEHPNTPPFSGIGESCFFRLNNNAEEDENGNKDETVKANVRIRNASIKAV